MIAGYEYRPVFQYKFRPLAHDSRALDGGFAVILYENRILSFSTYDVSGICTEELCFTLPKRVISCFHSLVRGAASWLGSSPFDLRGEDASPYASSFAFDGYDPIRIWGINTLLTEPAGSRDGFFARHLYVLFEDVANLFAENGIRLTLDGFTWDSSRVTPFRRKQVRNTGRQGAV